MHLPWSASATMFVRSGRLAFANWPHHHRVVVCAMRHALVVAPQPPVVATFLASYIAVPSKRLLPSYCQFVFRVAGF